MTTPVATTPTRLRRPEPPTKLSKSDTATAERAADDGERGPGCDAPATADPGPQAIVADTVDVDDEQLSWLEGDAVDVVPGADPFTSTLALISEADQMAIWVRLTPTAITAIVDQLSDVLALQHAALGIPHDTARTGTTDDENDDSVDRDDADDAGEDGGEDPAGPREGALRRARDPLGLRFIADRSSRAVWYIAGAVLLLAVAATVLARVNP